MTQTGPPVQAHEPAVEERLVGEYRLLARIGEGGMGVVHLARAADGRRVALKVLRPHVVGDLEARQRLAREVSSLRLVHSPRVAEVLDADPHGPTPYVATRYVPGLSLHEHVREEGPLAGTDLVHFARCLAEALLAVHAVGVLHRDVKPSNVLMEGRSPVLIDFGLARLAEDSRLTHTGWLLGTPGYLAPEILYGDDATPASDVHAWAATVAFAATGSPPYGRGPAMAVMDRVRRGEHDLRGVPEPLVGLLSESLAPEPLDRPGLHEIDAWLRSEQAGARAVEADDSSWTRPVVALERPSPTVVSRDPDPFDQLAAAPAEPTIVEGRPTPPDAAGQVPDDFVDPWADPSVDPRADPSVDPRADPSVPRADLSADPWADPWADLVADPAPHTRLLRPSDPLPPGIVPVPEPTGSRRQRLAMLLGLGGVVAVGVVAAPYLTILLGGLLVLLLRAASIGSERHQRRRSRRGRARWFDGPTTVLASPGYLLLSLVGSLLAVVWAVAASVAFGVVESIAQPPLSLGMLLMGVVFALSLWWGPGSVRLREVVGSGVARAARSDVAGLVVVGLCVVVVLALVVIALAEGPTWTPASDAPWSRGILAAVARRL